MRYVVACLLLLTAACANPGLRVGVEVAGQRTYESQEGIDPAYEVLCLAGTGVETLKVESTADGAHVSWGQEGATTDADLIYVEGPEGPSLLVVVPTTLRETWPLQLDAPRVLEFDVGGGVVSR